VQTLTDGIGDNFYTRKSGKVFMDELSVQIVTRDGNCFPLF